MPQENVQVFQVRILVRNDLAQETVEISERLNLSAQVFRRIPRLLPTAC